MMRSGWLLILLAGLSSCMVGPDYRSPDPVLPDRWQGARNPENALKPISANQLKTWWKTFNDPLLNRLMERAQTSNLDLKMAFARIEQARAERLANRAALFPKVGGNAAAAYLDNVLPGPTQGGNTLGFFLTGFDALWEIDVFGRLRRKLEAAGAAPTAPPRTIGKPGSSSRPNWPAPTPSTAICRISSA